MKKELYHVLSDSVENDIVWMFGSHVKNKLGDSKTLIGIEATEPVTYYYLLQHVNVNVFVHACLTECL